MIVFKACSSIETPINWYGDLWTLHADASEAKGIVDDLVQSLVDKVLTHYKVEGEYEIIMCFSDKENFRKKLYPLYKANRVGKRKPSGYYGVMNWCKENFHCCLIPNLEADDCIGILATKYKGDTVIISGDKDFKTIPSKFYDFSRNEFYEIDDDTAQYWHYYQTLIGDTADNYKGCPKCGDVTARRILDADSSWEAVVNAFEKQGLSEADALLQAQIARILHIEDYDTEKGEPILWTPK